MEQSTSKTSKVVFDRSKNVDDQEDIWDDRALIRAYERSLKKIRNKLSTAQATATYRGEEESQSDDEEEEVDDEDEEEGEGDNYETQEATAFKKKANPKEWSIGDLCMSVYSQDGLAYPANVIRIDGDTCTVKYLHYLNEEEKLLSELFVYEEMNTCKEKSRLEGTKPVRKTSEFMPPPPLTMPIPSLPGLETNVNEDDALHSMLISWYMSGYHTGFYHGLKSANAKNKIKV